MSKQIMRSELELPNPELPKAMWAAIRIAWVGAVFALMAAAYVWLFRGQLAWVTILTALVTLEYSIRLYRRNYSLPGIERDPFA